jgi:hypothetical protein
VSYIENIENEPDLISSMILFDELYCHSSGNINAQKYKINANSNEILFKFSDFHHFMDTYVRNNECIPFEIKEELRAQKSILCLQVLENGAYLLNEKIDLRGEFTLRPSFLLPLGHCNRIQYFSEGAIGFGIYNPEKGLFTALWVTMYETGLCA